MSRRYQHRNCTAVDCFSLALPHGFLCAHHCALLPAANQDELRSAFNAWQQKTGSRMEYLAARIRAIIDLAELEERTVPQIFEAILDSLDETNDLEMEA